MASNPHQMLSCPYNKAHQIESYRMQVHLEKCRKQHKDSNKVKCPFDATHIVSEVELEYHIGVCPKRDMFDRLCYVVEDSANYQSSASTKPVQVECDENWDNDNFESFKPDVSKKDAHVIRKIKGATPSERRQARMEGIKNYKPPTN